MGKHWQQHGVLVDLDVLEDHKLNMSQLHDSAAEMMDWTGLDEQSHGVEITRSNSSTLYCTSQASLE